MTLEERIEFSLDHAIPHENNPTFMRQFVIKMKENMAKLSGNELSEYTRAFRNVLRRRGIIVDNLENIIPLLGDSEK